MILYINSSIKNINCLLSKFEKKHKEKKVLQKINYLRVL